MDKAAAEAIARSLMSEYEGHPLPSDASGTLVALAAKKSGTTNGSSSNWPMWAKLHDLGLVSELRGRTMRKKITPRGRAVARALVRLEAESRKRIAAEAKARV